MAASGTVPTNHLYVIHWGDWRGQSRSPSWYLWDREREKIAYWHQSDPENLVRTNACDEVHMADLLKDCVDSGGSWDFMCPWVDIELPYVCCECQKRMWDEHYLCAECR